MGPLGRSLSICGSFAERTLIAALTILWTQVPETRQNAHLVATSDDIGVQIA